MAMSSYYHISSVPLADPSAGDWLTVEPQVPEAGETGLTIPRLCLAPSPAHCIAALGLTLRLSPWLWVYRAHPDTVLSEPEGVKDLEATGERWALSTTSLTLHACVPRASFDPHLLLSHWDEDEPLEISDHMMESFSPHWRGCPETVKDQIVERRVLASFWERNQQAFEGFAQQARAEGRLPT